MKTILLIRHAKAEWSGKDGTDFCRALSDSGIHEATSISGQLINKKCQLDAIVCSSSLRTIQTANIIGKELGIPPANMIYPDKLYHADANTIEQVVQSLSDENNSIALIAHNPGITDYVNVLMPGTNIDFMPTCGVFAVQSNCVNWKDFPASEKTLLFVCFPK
jgi:phosphohistidine phosphatase